MSHLLPAGELERYLFQSKLGAGGFGQVYRCFDQELNRVVAIKVVSNDSCSKLEAKLQAKFQHPHIVSLYDLVLNHNTLSMVMEYVSGESLLDQKLSLREIIAVGIEICDALALIHSHELTHQDIKPQNILRDPTTGNAKLTDFGAIARVLHSKQQQIVGTRKYIAPEQLSGVNNDCRSDIYALAKVLLELISVNRIRNIPPNLDQLLTAAAQKKPALRPGTVAEFQKNLLDVQADLQEKDYKIGSLIGALLAGSSLFGLLALPLFQAANHYPLVFSRFLAPLLATIVGFIYLPLACLMIAVVILVPLFFVWPALALVSFLALALLAKNIASYPKISLTIILLGIWLPTIL